MMYSHSFGPESGILFLVHGLAAALTFLGAFLLIVWMIRHLSGPQLKSMGLWLFGSGLVLCILTIILLAAAGHGRGRGGMMESKRWGAPMMNGGMMRGDRMMEGYGEYDDTGSGAVMMPDTDRR